MDKLKKQKLLSFIFLILFLILELFWSLFLIPNFKNISKTSVTIDTSINYDYNYIMELLTTYKAQGIKYYNYLQLFDIIFSVVYLLFFIFSFKFLFIYLEEKANFYFNKFLYIFIVILLPFLTYLFDSLENIFIFLIRKTYPYIPQIYVKLSNIFTILKFLFFFFNLILIILIIIKIIYLKLIKKT
jgi:hypothetical protein